MILNKNKPSERKRKVLFINASNEYQQHPEIRKLNQLGDEHIQKIANAYRDFSDEDGFWKAVPLDEIKINDNNLNVTLYVFPQEEIEVIDIKKKWEELGEIETELGNINHKIAEYLNELGIGK